MKNVEDIYPLSPMQQGMLFHTLYNAESDVYLTQAGYVLGENVDISLFRQTWQKLLDRHPALRSAFVWDGLDKPLQIVYQDVAISWDEQDWRDLSEKEQQTQFNALLRTDRQRGFELSQRGWFKIRFTLLIYRQKSI
ncbi:hypothetical protein KFU94_00060 [Chloroflexi bacterium TSY]|nr:hypothetical protein [Chloroflexi bacterium TSY]